MFHKDGHMLASASTTQYITESTIQSVASELLIKDLVNASLETQSIYSNDYTLKQQFDGIKKRTQYLIDNLDHITLKQYRILLDCFKAPHNKLSHYELFKQSYMTYRSLVTSGNVISIECAAYLYFLYR